jgi:hypothetical protein
MQRAREFAAGAGHGHGRDSLAGVRTRYMPLPGQGPLPCHAVRLAQTAPLFS